jgi:esterase/lipase superfamily enzyme
MNREYHKWHSSSLGREMDLLLYGHAGARVIVFPPSQGNPWDWEDRGMTQALAEHLENGWIQLYCVSCVDSESFYARWKWPGDRIRRHAQYDAYIANEVLPFTAHRNPNPFVIATGTSFGAYHAANFAFRYPHLVGRTIGLHGFYDIRNWMNGYHDELVYAHNPAEFVPAEQNPERLDALRRQDIILVSSSDDANRWSTEQLSGALWHKGVGNALRVWDGWHHDWPYWQRMIRMYIGGHD